MTVGERIRFLRIKKKLTQQELGNLIGVGKAAINKYETGVVENLKKTTITKLAEALNSTPMYLMGYSDESASYNDTAPETEYEILTAKRKELGMSIGELSEKSNVPKGTLSNILSGNTANPKLENVKAIANALGLSLQFVDLVTVHSGDDKYPITNNSQAGQREDPIPGNNDERLLINYYRTLNVEGQCLLLNTARAFIGNPYMRNEST